ncbi:MAG: hypothetical protein ABIG94_11295 [Pseudomonadota bacterium]
MNGFEKLKQLLGLALESSEESVIGEVESQAKTMKEIRETLGLPPDTPVAEIKERLKTLKTEHEELLGLKGQWEAREKKELGGYTQWQAFYKSEDWLGVWIGLGSSA